jgi:hypothetical protein
VRHLERHLSKAVEALLAMVHSPLARTRGVSNRAER